MTFYVYETQEWVTAVQRPIVIITSNNEKELPDAFLRRCFFHYIQFPSAEQMQEIVDVHYPDLKKNLLDAALKRFFELRDIPGLKKKPSTSELIDWLKLLMAEDIDPATLHSDDHKNDLPPLYGALVKNEQDIHLFEKLMFMARRQDR
jgi:MoxR-like ATPase